MTDFGGLSKMVAPIQFCFDTFNGRRPRSARGPSGRHFRHFKFGFFCIMVKSKEKPRTKTQKRKTKIQIWIFCKPSTPPHPNHPCNLVFSIRVKPKTKKPITKTIKRKTTIHFWFFITALYGIVYLVGSPKWSILEGSPKWSLQYNFALTVSMAGGRDRPEGPPEAISDGFLVIHA